MSYFHAINGQGGSPEPPTSTALVTTLHYDIPVSNTGKTSVTIDIKDDYEGYADITLDNISVQFGKATANVLSSGANETLSYSYNDGVITITSASSNIPFACNVSSTLPVDVTIYNPNTTEVSEAPVLLWTNRNPSSAFAEGTLNIDFTSYSGAIVETNVSTVYVRKTDSFPKGIGYRFPSDSEFWGYNRNITAFNDSGITFSGAVVPERVDNSMVIPLKIYGVKSVVIEPITGMTPYYHSTTDEVNKTSTYTFSESGKFLIVANYDGNTNNKPVFNVSTKLMDYTNHPVGSFIGQATLEYVLADVSVGDTVKTLGNSSFYSGIEIFKVA